MKLPEIHLRDCFWLILVVALALAWGSERFRHTQATLRHARTMNEVSHFSKLYLSDVEMFFIQPEYPNSFGDTEVRRRHFDAAIRSKTPHRRNARNGDDEPLTSRGFANP